MIASACLAAGLAASPAFAQSRQPDLRKPAGKEWQTIGGEAS